MKILAIDDNQDNLISLKALIKDTFPDALTLTALNGGRGLELAAVEDPDVILLDIVMPGIDGFEVCRKLKADKKLSDIPVIFITALKGDKESHVHALECGADAFLSKPVEEIELIAQIRAMVKIKTANIQKFDEKKRLATLVEDQTRELKETHTATLNLLEDLRKENKSRKVIEDVLRENESRLRFALEGSNDGLWDVQMQTGHVYLSPRGCEILGYGTAGLPDTIWKWNQLVHPDDLPISNKRMEEHIAGRSPIFEMEQRLLTSSGEWKWILTRGKVVTRDANGKPIRMTGTHTDISKSKQALTALREREEMYRALVSSLPDMVFRFDCEGRHLFVSENIREVVDFQPVQLIGKTHRELGFPEDLCQLSEKGLRSVLNSGTSFETEFKLEGKNGERIYNLRFVPERDEQDVIRSILCISRDISAHRQAERDYHMLFQEMLNGFALHEIICDEKGKPVNYRFLAINPAFERMTGLNAEDLVGRTVLEALPETERHWIETYGKVALTGKPIFFDNYASDLKKHFEVTAFSPEPNRFACIFTDITERKLVERRLVLSAEILGILNEPISLPDMVRGVISVIKKDTGFDAVGIRLKTGDDFPYFDQDGFSNDFLLTENILLESDMAGGACKDKDGKPCLQCTCGLVISGKTDPASPLFTPGGSFWTNNSPVLLNIPADQDPRLHPRNKCIHDGYASVALIPIRANQEIVGLLQLNNREKDSLTLDMVRFFEGINASFGVALMQKLAEKEKAEIEQQLRESQKMDAVGQLAGGISHDFNNLLSIVNGYAQILLREPDLNDTVRFNIEEILKSGERAAMLTRQLLTFSRRQPIEVRIIDLNAVVSNMNTMLRRVVKENISMTMVTGYDLWQIKADTGQIEQVIMNLVINARDAMPDGGTLTLETANVEIDEGNRFSHYSEIKPGFYAMLSVGDTGCGMDEKVRKHIFEPFFTTKEVGKGTGLGLATVYGILKQSNACVDVQSEPGKGTKFRIYFPKAVNESAVSEQQTELAAIPRGTETILLAEDEKIMRQMLKDFLQSIGYTVIPARDGNEALELFEGHKGQIHLLLTDIVMPGTTGFELAKQVKNLAPEIKLLFMSGYAKPTDTLKMMNITDNLIDKPINLHKMAVKLRKILDG